MSIVVLSSLVVMLFPIVVKSQDQGQQAICISNQKQIATALLLYAKEHDNVLPAAPSVWTSIQVPAHTLQCPAVAGNHRSYGFNMQVAGTALDKITEPSCEPLTADCDRADGSINLAADVARRHENGYVSSFADGHAEYIKNQVLHFPQWQADNSSAERFAASIRVLPDSYAYPSKATIPLSATYDGASRTVTQWDQVYQEGFTAAQPVYPSMAVGYTYLFEVTLTQPRTARTGLNVIFGDNSQLGAEDRMPGYIADERLPNAIALREEGAIYGSTDWDGERGPTADANTAGQLVMAVTPLEIANNAITKVNLKYYYNGRQFLGEGADGKTMTGVLHFPVSVGLVTHAENITVPGNWPYTVKVAHWRTRVIPANNTGVTVQLPKKSFALTDHCVWAHYVPWDDWNQTPLAAKSYYDFPLAHPTGDLQQDYRQEIDAAMQLGINGFLVDVIRGDVFSYQAKNILKAAQRTNFTVSICLDGFPDTAEQYAQKIADFLSSVNDEPNLARIDGKPLLTTFWAYRQPPAYWQTFRKELTKRGIQVFLVADPVPVTDAPGTGTTAYPGCFDMLYSFTSLEGMANDARGLFPYLAKQAQTDTSTGRWMACVSPGYIGAWPFMGINDYYNGFRGIDKFWDNWALAAKLNSPWIHLTTWNDLIETPLQPMTFQFHTYPELTRYWIARWRGKEPTATTPRLYLAYQREQVVGTVQRIELVSLPSTTKSFTVTLELRDITGKTLCTLPAKTFPGNEAIRRDWAVPTAAFAKTPIVEPVLHVTADRTIFVRRLPFFTLRTGWIANKSSIRVPVHEMSDGNARLSLTKDPAGNLQAALTLQSPSTVRQVTLWRNDRPFGNFSAQSPSGVTYHLGFIYLRNDTTIKMSLTGGTILNAYYAGDSQARQDLHWSPKSLSVIFQRDRQLAVDVLDSDDATLNVSVGDAPAQSISMVALRHGPIDLKDAHGDALCRLVPDEIGCLAMVAPPLELKQANLSGQWYTKNTFPTDLFYARCETADGRFFYSNVVAPFCATALVPTTILQTAETLDGGAIGGGGFGAFFTTPPF
ncbi:MAG TPA: endo-1,3-alpha-glucanase family glycosylhydrolase, partial [Armatimonadota bacterium]|nr:endo-1,3-alpha-glucanase family glycosylhydrolase [Armatimonadota bacterium]